MGKPFVARGTQSQVQNISMEMAQFRGSRNSYNSRRTSAYVHVQVSPPRNARDEAEILPRRVLPRFANVNCAPVLANFTDLLYL